MAQRRIRPIPERAAFLGQFLTKRLDRKNWCLSVDVDAIDERFTETSLATLATGEADFGSACEVLGLRRDDDILLELGLLSYSRADTENPEWQAEMLALNQAVREMVRARQENYKYRRRPIKRRKRRILKKISPGD